MLGLSKKTHAELMRTELAESLDHFMRAASHAANGFGRSVGPRAHTMRGFASRGWGTTAAALAPLAMAYREGAADATAAALKVKGKSTGHRKGTHVARKRTGMFVGLLAIGAAAGVVAALMMKRRKQMWSEYDSPESLDSVSSDMRSMGERTAYRGGETMDRMGQSAGHMMDKAADKLQSASSSLRNTDYKSQAQSTLDDATRTTGDSTSTSSGSVTSSSYNTRP